MEPVSVYRITTLQYTKVRQYYLQLKRKKLDLLSSISVFRKYPFFQIHYLVFIIYILWARLYVIIFCMITIKKFNFYARFQAISILVVTMNQDSFLGQSWYLLAWLNGKISYDDMFAHVS